MQDKTWYSILGLDAEPLFLQDTMLKCTLGFDFQFLKIKFYSFYDQHQPDYGVLPFNVVSKINKSTQSKEIAVLCLKFRKYREQIRVGTNLTILIIKEMLRIVFFVRFLGENKTKWPKFEETLVLTVNNRWRWRCGRFSIRQEQCNWAMRDHLSVSIFLIIVKFFIFVYFGLLKLKIYCYFR